MSGTNDPIDLFSDEDSAVALVAIKARKAAEAAAQQTDGDAQAVEAARQDVERNAGVAAEAEATVVPLAADVSAKATQVAADKVTAGAARDTAVAVAANAGASVANAAPSFTAFTGSAPSISAWVAGATDLAIANYIPVVAPIYPAPWPTMDGSGNRYGTYRKRAGVAVWEAPTVADISGNFSAPPGTDNSADAIGLLGIMAPGQPSPRIVLWTYPDGDVDAGAFDGTFSARFKARLLGSIPADISGVTAITGRFRTTFADDNAPMPWAIGFIGPDGKTRLGMWFYEPGHPEEGKFDADFSLSFQRRILSGLAPIVIPTSLFTATDIEKAGSAGDAAYSSAEEGWPQRYRWRTQDSAPTIAWAESPYRCIGVSVSGQSNSRGQTSPAAQAGITISPFSRHRAFSLTLGTNQGDVGSPDAQTTLVPLYEGTMESPCSGIVKYAQARDAAKGLPSRLYLAEGHGQGGYSISQLVPGTPQYIKGTKARSQLVKLAALQGMPSVWYPAHNFDQGESDRGMARLDYYNFGLAYQAGNEAELRGLTKQAEPVWWVLTQLQSRSGPLGVGAITALPQHDLMLGAPRTTLCGAFYWMKDDYGLAALGAEHYLPLGHAVRAEYHGRANYLIQSRVEEAVRKGNDPWALTIADIRTCLRPNLAARSVVGKVFTIPIAALPDGTTDVAIDTSWLPAAPGLGFVKTGGTAGAITDVRLVGSAGNRAIEIETATAGSLTVTYANEAMDLTVARASGWGNFRSSTPWGTSAAKPGLALHDWLVTFDASF